MSQLKVVKIKDGEDFRVINESDFNASTDVLCDGETLSNVDQITVQLTTKISPELQKLMDDTKAECLKVQNENIELKEQLKNHKSVIAERDALAGENSILQVRLAELLKLSAAKDQSNDLLADSAKETKKK